MRLLTELTTEDVAAAADLVAVQPIGAVEQHGPHLPLGTDAILAERTAHAAVEALGDPRLVVLPTLSYGTSSEHLGWAGTMSLGTTTMLAVLADVGASLAASGVRRLVLVNGHGGQVNLLQVVARDLRVAHGLQVTVVTPLWLDADPGHLLSDPLPVHGGQEETSLMLHLAPELVRPDLAVAGGLETAALYDTLSELTIEGGVSPAWVSCDVTDNGVIGDPSGASAAIGAAIHAEQVRRLTGALRELVDFSFPFPAPSPEVSR